MSSDDECNTFESMKIECYATDLPVEDEIQLDEESKSTNIILNQHIYLKITFDQEEQSKSITVTIESQMQTSPPYILDPEFINGSVYYYHLEFEQHEPLPSEIFVGELNIVHFSESNIEEQQIQIRVTNPVNLKILEIEQILRKPAIIFEIQPKKTVEIVSLIFQCHGQSEEYQNIENSILTEDYSYRHFILLESEVFEQLCKYVDELNVTIMYKFKNQINTVYFNFNCQDWIQIYKQNKQQSQYINLQARLVEHVPQSHCDLEKNNAYYAVSLEIDNLSSEELKDIIIYVEDVPEKIVALTRKIQLSKLEIRQSATVYLEFYSYEPDRIVPDIEIELKDRTLQFENVLLIE